MKKPSCLPEEELARAECRVMCPDCGSRMRLRNSRYGLFYGCTRFPACKATHGAHPNGKPLGVPADEATKRFRIEAHSYFDRLWMREHGGWMRRGEAYAWMRETMSMSAEEAHIGRFTIAQCKWLVANVIVELERAGKQVEMGHDNRGSSQESSSG